MTKKYKKGDALLVVDGKEYEFLSGTYVTFVRYWDGSDLCLVTTDIRGQCFVVWVRNTIIVPHNLSTKKREALKALLCSK